MAYALQFESSVINTAAVQFYTVEEAQQDAIRRRAFEHYKAILREHTNNVFAANGMAMVMAEQVQDAVIFHRCNSALCKVVGSPQGCPPFVCDAPRTVARYRTGE